MHVLFFIVIIFDLFENSYITKFYYTHMKHLMKHRDYTCSSYRALWQYPYTYFKTDFRSDQAKRIS